MCFVCALCVCALLVYMCLNVCLCKHAGRHVCSEIRVPKINKQVTFAKSSGGGDQKLSQGTSGDRSRACSGLKTFDEKKKKEEG